MGLIASDTCYVVIGLGITGLSCARYLQKRGAAFALADTRKAPPNLEALRADYPNVALHLGPLTDQTFAGATHILLSPGVCQMDPAIQRAVARGVKLSGDIDLFCQQVDAPIVAITGSNAKSTVTTLVGAMAKAAGLNVAVGGNLGTPVLDMLDGSPIDLCVLELSSFQLETTNDLRAKVATVLNVSPDHLDRYSGMQAYHQAKHRVFRGCENAVENRDDTLTHPLLPMGVPLWGYRLGTPEPQVFGLIEDDAGEWLALGTDKLMPVAEIRMPGRHNVANALSALALGKLAGLPLEPMLATLRAFPGLEHRCQWVAEKEGVTYYNDSKGTNVGATVAALVGLGPELPAGNNIILIAGGDGKGAEFDELLAPIQRYVGHTLLLGKDATRIEAALSGQPVSHMGSLETAVAQACQLAESGDVVLLSPACSSLDMFTSYGARGDAFVAAVAAL